MTAQALIENLADNCPWYDDGTIKCATCDSVSERYESPTDQGAAIERAMEPERHAMDCPWRQAMTYLGRKVGTG